MAGLAVALRFVPYSDDHGTFRTGWTVAHRRPGVSRSPASVYVVYMLEILKFKRFRMRAGATRAPRSTRSTGASSATWRPASSPASDRPHRPHAGPSLPYKCHGTC